MQKVVDQEEATISSLEHVLNVLDSLTQGSKDGRMSLDDIANAYQQLQVIFIYITIILTINYFSNQPNSF